MKGEIERKKGEKVKKKKVNRNERMIRGMKEDIEKKKGKKEKEKINRKRKLFKEWMRK